MACSAAALGAWFVADLRPDRRGVRVARGVTRGLLAVCAATAAATELPWQIGASWPASDRAARRVIGGSLSARLNPTDTPWPAVPANRHALRVRNLARAGATTSDARTQAEQLTDAGTVVVVLIGGNDVIARRPVAHFERDLDSVLRTARSGGRPVAMVELPLVPGFWACGGVQRRHAARHGVMLIPRWRLALILADRTATIDGIHLTAKGSGALAEAVWRHIGGTFAAAHE